jgi:predicted CoA-binding protein
LIEQILEQRYFAVTGVSRNPEKYGHIVYQKLKAAGYTVYAINPNTDSIDGDVCYPSLDNVPGPIDCVVTVTPPAVTEKTVRAAGYLRIPFVWMQPGSESTSAYNLARSLSMQIVSGGPCIMVSAAQRQTARARVG